MSPLLQEFYDECYKAINDHPPYWFSFTGGLCWNLIHFLDYKKSDRHSELRNELMDQFYGAELDMFNPFNPSKVNFYNEINKYDNPLRVQWIKDHITKVPLHGLPNPDHTKCSIERLGVCGCAFGQCAKGLIY